jgi:hypothetical protein
MKQNFFSSGQAAKELKISSYRVRRLCETGLIPGVELTESGQWLIPPGEIARISKEGVPSTPKTVDADAPESKPNAAGNPSLLAEPSELLVDAAEQAEISNRDLTTAKNELERKKISREAVEVDDFFEERQRRRQQEAEEEERSLEEAAQEDIRRRETAAAKEERQRFFSEWTEHAIRQKPWGAPQDVEIDIHSEVLATLAKVDTKERDFVVRRLVDAAVNRALAGWRSGEQKRKAIEEGIGRLPYNMRWDGSPWKAQVRKAASDAVDGLRACATLDEVQAAVDLALRPLVSEFQHAERIQSAIAQSMSIPNANSDDLDEAKETVGEALSALPVGATERQIQQASDRALTPIRDRIYRREALSRVAYHLPGELSDAAKKDAIADVEEALDQLPEGSSMQEMESTRDQVIKRYRMKTDRVIKRSQMKAHLIDEGLSQVRPYAELMLKRWDYEPGQTAWSIQRRVEASVREALNEEVSGSEDAEFVTALVRRTMRAAEGCR